MNELVMRSIDSDPVLQKGMEDALSDHALIVQFQSADGTVRRAHKNKAYELLLDRYYQRFYYLAFRLLQDTQDAEDCVQDCFLKLWHKPDIWKADGGASFATFFTHIVVHRARDIHRKKRFLKLFKGQNEHSESDGGAEDLLSQASVSLTMSAEGLPQDYVDEKQRALRLKKAMLALPHRQREAVILCFYEELSNAEAAKIMRVGVKALESLLMRAKKNLRDIMKHKEGETW